MPHAGLTSRQWRLIASYQQIAADSFSGRTHLFLSGQRFIEGLNYGLPAHIQAAILHIAAVGYNPDATKADKNEELTALFSMLYQMSTRKTCKDALLKFCLLYTSPSPRDATLSRMPSSA